MLSTWVYADYFWLCIDRVLDRMRILHMQQPLLHVSIYCVLEFTQCIYFLKNVVSQLCSSLGGYLYNCT